MVWKSSILLPLHGFRSDCGHFDCGILDDITLSGTQELQRKDN